MIFGEDRQTDRRKPAIGIIMLDTVFPRIPGDIGNPDTFPFPVRYEVVKGATPARVVNDTDPRLLDSFIEAASVIERAGVKAIATSCGYLSIFHRELVEAIRVPIFTSSLLQVHSVFPVIKKDQKIGIITARKQSLTTRHLEGVGIESYPLVIAGMDEAEEFTAVFIKEKRTIDVEKCRAEMTATAKRLVDSHPDIGAIVLECTNMPPFLMWSPWLITCTRPLRDKPLMRGIHEKNRCQT
jgi:hypothetical protein